MQIADHLRDLEEQLLQPEVRKDPGVLSTFIADDFLEIGSSGRIYDKAAILTALIDEPNHPPAFISNFSVRTLVEDVALVTYRTSRSNTSGPNSSVQRTSIWIFRNDRWQIVFHQGTPLPAAP
jgi:hypothetical protein